ncbi:MAG TPA: DUF4124 domain-containing protein [Steroidobacteraceae bacterium]|nr:DUF4124 domain-containing protein [Steroidobacteraceae bacterium]
MSLWGRRLKVLGWLAAASLVASAALAGKPQPNGKTTYRWVDDQGVVHYGDQIPPQYAGKDREVINPEGIPVQHVDGTKSAEQLAAEARDRAAEIKQKQHDSFLVTTYTSVKDIEALRDARLDQLHTQRYAAQQYIESLKARLGALQSRALSFRPYSSAAGARRMPDDLAEDLVRTLNEMRTQTSALATSNEEEAKLRAQFQADIERYRELHTLHSND